MLVSSFFLPTNFFFSPLSNSSFCIHSFSSASPYIFLFPSPSPFSPSTHKPLHI